MTKKKIKTIKIKIKPERLSKSEKAERAKYNEIGRIMKEEMKSLTADEIIADYKIWKESRDQNQNKENEKEGIQGKNGSGKDS